MKQLNVADLQAGDILLFTQNPFNAMERLITGTEGDTIICHAAMVGANEMRLYTTGVGPLNRFGRFLIKDYVKGRTAIVCRYPLTVSQRYWVCVQAATLLDSFYAWHRVWALAVKVRFGGVVSRVWPWKTGLNLKGACFCSEAVAYAYWKIGIKLCEGQGKQEPSAIAPVNLYREALSKDSPLEIMGRISG